MGGTAIGTDFNFGFPGAIARHGEELVKSRPVSTGATAIPFGSPVVLHASGGVTDGTVEAFGASNVADDFIGIACRRIKQATGAGDVNFGKYYDTDICDILERGSIMVLCPTGNPQPGGAVYIRVLANAGDYPDAQVGDIEAVSDTDDDGNGNTTYNNLLIPNCKWRGTKDSNNVAELVILERTGV